MVSKNVKENEGKKTYLATASGAIGGSRRWWELQVVGAADGEERWWEPQRRENNS